VIEAIRPHGVLLHGSGQMLRACTHLDITAAMAERAAETIRKVTPKVVAV
jgi:hypothetical protein